MPRSYSNEFGDYLQYGESELVHESERIKASNDDEAEELCEEVARQYGGINSQAEPMHNAGDYDCHFQVWTHPDE